MMRHAKKQIEINPDDDKSTHRKLMRTLSLSLARSILMTIVRRATPFIHPFN